MREEILLSIFDIIFILRIQIEKREYFRIITIEPFLQENIFYPLSLIEVLEIKDLNRIGLIPKILFAGTLFVFLIYINQSLKALMRYDVIAFEKVVMGVPFLVVTYYHSLIIFLKCLKIIIYSNNVSPINSFIVLI